MDRIKQPSLVVGLGLLPVAHPLLLPWVGVASHLLWWVHVLPVAVLTYRHGRRGAVWGIGVSVGWLIVGERFFGAGYGIPADWATTLSLAVALLFTEVLVAGFAFYARGVSRRYQLLFEGAEMGILRTGADERIREVNPAAEELLSRRREELVGRRVHEVSGLSDLPPLEKVRSTAGWSGTITGEGEELRHLVVAAMSQRDPRGHQVLLMDRTPEVARELEQERQRKLAGLGEALAGVAHELKNPLAVILAEEELARTDPEPSVETLRGTLAEIRRQGQRIRTLIDELLGYSRPAPEQGAVDLGPLLRRLVRIEEMIRRGTVRWERHIEWEGMAPLEESKIEQIVTNLLSNAAEAMAQEGATGELRCWATEDQVHIEVLDSGPGIPSELLDRIFAPFVTTKASSGGTGLGLAISQRLARAMGGDLEARNRTSGGAAFLLTLPLAPASSLPGIEQFRPRSVQDELQGHDEKDERNGDQDLERTHEERGGLEAENEHDGWSTAGAAGQQSRNAGQNSG